MNSLDWMHDSLFPSRSLSLSQQTWLHRYEFFMSLMVGWVIAITLTLSRTMAHERKSGGGKRGGEGHLSCERNRQQKVFIGWFWFMSWERDPSTKVNRVMYPMLFFLIILLPSISTLYLGLRSSTLTLFSVPLSYISSTPTLSKLLSATSRNFDRANSRLSNARSYENFVSFIYEIFHVELHNEFF